MCIVIVCVLADAVFADVPLLLNYQGRLTNPGGAPVNGTLPMTFRLCDAVDGGTVLWEEPQTVVVAEQIPRLQTKGHRLSQLLGHPVHRRTVGRREMKDLAAAVVENQKHVQRGEVDSRDSEEVNRPGHVEMVPKERQPSC